MTVIERLRKKKEHRTLRLSSGTYVRIRNGNYGAELLQMGGRFFIANVFRCGHAGNAIPAKTADLESRGLTSAEFDYEADNQWEKAKSDEYSRAAWEIDQEFHLIYEEYLHSKEWRIKRAKILERSGGFCEVCEDRPAVTAHHKTYEKLCCEPLEDLTAVCQSCHELLHGRQQ